jgi:alpha-tubulin suppressor-like RCC1 family protein
MSLTSGSNGALLYDILPENATYKGVSWFSGNPAAVSVKGNGMVTAHSAGGPVRISVITDDGNHEAHCDVSVITPEHPVTAVALNKAATSLAIGSTETLVPTVSPSNATIKAVAWSSNNPGVASVNSATGLISALSEGSARITVTSIDGNRMAHCDVAVTTPTPANIAMTQTLKVHVGETKTLRVTKQGIEDYTVSIYPAEGLNFAKNANAIRVTGVTAGTYVVVVASTADTFTQASATVKVINRGDEKGSLYEWPPEPPPHEPEGAFTRGQWIQMLGDKLGFNYGSDFSHWEYYYSDTKGHVNGLAVEIARAHSILPPASQGAMFYPNAVASREFAAFVAISALGFMEAEYTFTCNDFSALQYPGHVGFAVGEGLMALVGGSFRPNDPLSHSDSAGIFAAIDALEAAKEIDPEFPREEVDYAEGVIIDSLSQVTDYTITEHSDDTMTVNLPKNAATLEIKPGEVFILPPNPDFYPIVDPDDEDYQLEMPTQMAFKAISISDLGARLSILCAEPEFNELFEDVFIEQVFIPNLEDIVLAQGVRLISGYAAKGSGNDPQDGITIDPEGYITLETEVGGVTIGVKFKLPNPNVRVNLGATWRPPFIVLKEIRATLSTNSSLTFSAKVGGVSSDPENWFTGDKAKRGRIPLFAIPIPSHPVNIALYADLVINLDGMLEIEFALKYDLGFEKLNNQSLRQIKDFSCSLESIKLQAELKAGIEAGASLRVLNLKALELAKLAVETGLALKGSGAWYPFGPPSWCLDFSTYFYADIVFDTIVTPKVTLGIFDDNNTPWKKSWHVEDWDFKNALDDCSRGKIKIAVEPKTATIVANATQQFAATVTGGKGNTNVIWSVSPPTGGGAINASGLYTAPAAPGTYYVSARSVEDSSKWDTAVVTVNLPPATGVSLNKNTLTLQAGSKEAITAAVQPANARNTNVTWSSSNISIASVIGGVVRGVGAGTATITVHTIDGGFADACSVTVTPLGAGTGHEWTQMSAGAEHNLALKSDGSLWAWGANIDGQLGLGDDGWDTHRNVPTQVGTSKDWAAVWAGEFSSMAQKTDGSLWAWGRNAWGQLGLGDSWHRNVPTQVGASKEWATVCMGGEHTIALKNDGSLWACGNNNNNRYGDSTIENSNEFVRIGTDTDWAALSSGGGVDRNLALKTDGSLWSWGAGSFGGLGLGGITSQTTPARIDADNDWAFASVGGTFSVAGKTDGSIFAFGSSDNGQLGLGEIPPGMVRVPVRIGTDSDWASASARGAMTLALKDDGSLWAWGHNDQGQLGDGTNANRNAPVQIGTDADWAFVSAGGGHAMALKNDGSLWTWGGNYFGNLGLGDDLYRNTPTRVGQATISLNKNEITLISGTSESLIATILPVYASSHSVAWSTSNPAVATVDDDGVVTAVSLGAARITATAAAGGHSAFCNVTVIPTQFPVTGITLSHSEATLAINRTLALVATVLPPSASNKNVIWSTSNGAVASISNGTVTGVGLGLATSSARSADGGHPASCVVTIIDGLVGDDNDWLAISSGGSHTMAIKADHSLWAWGSNAQGQLGDGTITSRSQPRRIGSASNWAFVSAGAQHTVALTNDGALWAWGAYSPAGQSNAPVRIGADADWKAIAAGGSHTLALKADGSLWAWGENQLGQLGLGTWIASNAPARVGSDADWKLISAGQGHSVAIKANSQLWAWGHNYHGQLGDDSTVSRNAPKRVGADADWAYISAGDNHTMAIKANGSLWAWGNNAQGQLGDGTVTLRRESPFRIGADANWAAISAGSLHTAALRTDGSLWAWGHNAKGQLGDGTTIDRNIPGRIGQEANWMSISAGGSHSAALKNNGSLWAWGDGSGGQLGSGAHESKNAPAQVIKAIRNQEK